MNTINSIKVDQRPQYYRCSYSSNNAMLWYDLILRYVTLCSANHILACQSTHECFMWSFLGRGSYSGDLWPWLCVKIRALRLALVWAQRHCELDLIWSFQRAKSQNVGKLRSSRLKLTFFVQFFFFFFNRKSSADQRDAPAPIWLAVWSWRAVGR